MNGARPRAKRGAKTGRPYNSNKAEHEQHKLHRDLIAFDDFRSTILPALRKDLKSGMTPKQLREKYSALVQARLITDAMTTTDPKEAAQIGKDLIDRVEGKATEKKEVTHRFKDMSDKELDAILESEEADLKDMEERFDQ